MVVGAKVEFLAESMRQQSSALLHHNRHVLGHAALRLRGATWCRGAVEKRTARRAVVVSRVATRKEVTRLRRKSQGCDATTDCKRSRNEHGEGRVQRAARIERGREVESQ